MHVLKARWILLLVIVVLVAALPLSLMTSAQDSGGLDPNAPLYIAYCETDTWNEIVTTSMTGVEPMLTEVNDYLASYDTGNITALEGITNAENFLTQYNAIGKLNCMAPMYLDLQRGFSELLIAMLYSQLGDSRFTLHMQLAREAFVNARAQIDQAAAYIVNPLLPTPTPGPTNTPSADRTPEELSSELTTFLGDNGVTLLRTARVDVFPDGAVVTASIDALPNFDNYLNVVFTFDIMADLIEGWGERDDIARVIVEVYDGESRIMYVESTGDSFRSYYFDDSITLEEFEGALTRFDG